MTQFMAASSARLNGEGWGFAGGCGYGGAPDRGVSHEMVAPGGVRMICPPDSFLTGQVHEEAVWSDMERIQEAFTQLTTGAVVHDWNFRGNWAYEKVDIPLDGWVSGCPG